MDAHWVRDHWSDWSATHTHCPSMTTRPDIEPLDHITWTLPTTGCARWLPVYCPLVANILGAVWMGYSTHSRVPTPKRRKRQPTRSLAPGTSEGGSRPAVTSASRSCVYLSSERCMLPSSSSFQVIPAHSSSFRLVPITASYSIGYGLSR